MKSPWLNAVVLAVALAASACGPTDETLEPEQGNNVEQQLPMCDENGVCPTGYYCEGGAFGVCRRGTIEPLLYACTDDGRCPTGYYCDGSVCRRQVIELLYPCTDDGRCPVGYYCDGSACRRELAAQ